ncbi:MAG: VCBS repeat-containing protein [Planctomycetes bacterium]|nr:VCBS repeat-containing protein [Planctomycetota bacterium]
MIPGLALLLEARSPATLPPVALSLLALAAVTTAQDAAPTAWQPTAPVVGERLVDTDGDGVRELVVVDAAGTVTVLALTADGLAERGRLALPDPGHCLGTIADFGQGPGLVLADRSGTSFQALPRHGQTTPAPVRLAARARCTLRTDRPQLRPFVQDLDRDGRLDLLLPSLAGVQPFVQEAPDADGTLRFRALPVLAVPVAVSAAQSSGDLDDEHQGSVSVPQIETADLDGDGRPDLVTRQGSKHRFHLQGGDGVFQAPLEVDLEQFVDSTQKAATALGSTLVLGEKQQLQRGDIDGDGIPDFVIAHRRKVWTFLSSRSGPQFTKARTQAVADDVSGMLLVDLDQDDRADLLTFQVQLPGAATLLLGLVQATDIDIRAVGYRSENGAFVNAPTWRRTVVLRIPALLSLLSRQDELVQRFVDILGKVRPSVRGAFRADGAPELAVVRGDGAAVEWVPATAGPAGLSGRAGRQWLRRLLFDDPNPLFDLERLFGLVQSVVEGAVPQSEGASVRRSLPLRDPAAWRVVRLLAGELDGVAGQELVVVYAAVADEERVQYEVLSAR